ncbi:unnamed protein product [Amoebophrya sp. A120]|nr:unnamed protein product [Amoebophrya sp. A120]|eukprot:GSA120T00012959001.1
MPPTDQDSVAGSGVFTPNESAVLPVTDSRTHANSWDTYDIATPQNNKTYREKMADMQKERNQQVRQYIRDEAEQKYTIITLEENLQDKIRKLRAAHAEIARLQEILRKNGLEAEVVRGCRYNSVGAIDEEVVPEEEVEEVSHVTISPKDEAERQLDGTNKTTNLHGAGAAGSASEVEGATAVRKVEVLHLPPVASLTAKSESSATAVAKPSVPLTADDLYYYPEGKAAEDFQQVERDPGEEADSEYEDIEDASEQHGVADRPVEQVLSSSRQGSSSVGVASLVVAKPTASIVSLASDGSDRVSPSAVLTSCVLEKKNDEAVCKENRTLAESRSALNTSTSGSGSNSKKPPSDNYTAKKPAPGLARPPPAPESTPDLLEQTRISNSEVEKMEASLRKKYTNLKCLQRSGGDNISLSQTSGQQVVSPMSASVATTKVSPEKRPHGTISALPSLNIGGVTASSSTSSSRERAASCRPAAFGISVPMHVPTSALPSPCLQYRSLELPTPKWPVPAAVAGTSTPADAKPRFVTRLSARPPPRMPTTGTGGSATAAVGTGLPPANATVVAVETTKSATSSAAPSPLTATAVSKHMGVLHYPRFAKQPRIAQYSTRPSSTSPAAETPLVFSRAVVPATAHQTSSFLPAARASVTGVRTLVGGGAICPAKNSNTTPNRSPSHNSSSVRKLRAGSADDATSELQNLRAATSTGLDSSATRRLGASPVDGKDSGAELLMSKTTADSAKSKETVTTAEKGGEHQETKEYLRVARSDTLEASPVS